MPHEKEKRDAILAALRAVVDAGGPQTPVVSTPRVTGSLTRPSSRDTANPIETPMGKLLGLFSGLADPGNIGVGAAGPLVGTAKKAAKKVISMSPQEVVNRTQSIKYREESIAKIQQEIDKMYSQLPTQGGIGWSDRGGWQGYETGHWDRSENFMAPIRDLQKQRDRYGRELDKDRRRLAAFEKAAAREAQMAALKKP